MCSDVAIRVESISKCFQIYEKPHHRLLQMLSRGRARYYREFWALRDVSFDVMKGETVGIVGRNGSGKSTLLQIICGTLTPTSGMVQTSGRVAALLELGSGFNPEFSGRDNVYLNGAVLGLSREEVDSRYDDIAAFADIGSFIDQPVRTYSSGMMVRLAFAVAINVNPRVLVIDEALAVGDELFQRKCFSAIEKIKKDGATILLVSHSASAVVSLSDRAILIDAGERVGIGQPKRVVSGYQKILYAPDAARERLRCEIRELLTVSDGEPGGLGKRAMPGEVASPDGADEVMECYDPALIPHSRVEFESRGAKISGPELLGDARQRINNLKKGRACTLSYRVSFDAPATAVRFGMLVKTMSGVHIGGALSAGSLEDAIPVVVVGESFTVNFRFRCNLNPGLYFLNTGVFGDIGDGETVLHRIVDAVAFRVLPEAGNLSTEIVDLGFSVEVGHDA